MHRRSRSVERTEQHNDGQAKKPLERATRHQSDTSFAGPGARPAGTRSRGSRWHPRSDQEDRAHHRWRTGRFNPEAPRVRDRDRDPRLGQEPWSTRLGQEGLPGAAEAVRQAAGQRRKPTVDDAALRRNRQGGRGKSQDCSRENSHASLAGKRKRRLPEAPAGRLSRSAAMDGKDYPLLPPCRGLHGRRRERKPSWMQHASAS